MITRWLGTALTLVVMLSSGTYLLVYLYRWEWNRALVAGVIFVAAEVALVATSLLKRLRAIESRLDQRQEASIPLPLERLRETAPERGKPFEWLDPTQMNVFVPVLLGAGVLLSVIAHGVERLAGATATPLRERALADRLDAISLPAAGLRPSGAAAGLGALRVTPTRAPRAWRPIATRSFGVVVALFLLVVAVQLIADETQDRPDPRVTTGSAEVVLRVDNRFTGRSQLHTAEALFVACRHTLGDRFRATGFDDGGRGVIAFTVTPGFGEHAERRFEGCLEDAVFDRIGASVASLVHKP